MESKNRIIWIDAAKMIGILLVIMGHTSGNELMNLFVYSFHMPLFFFLSGYTYNDHHNTIFIKLKKNAKRYLLPYIWASVATMLIIGVLGTWYYDFRSNLPYDNILERVSGMFYETIVGYGTGMLWFLSIMFCTKLVMDLLASIIKSGRGAVVVLIGLLVLAPCVKEIGVLTWNLDILPITFFYCYLGYFIKVNRIAFKWKIAVVCVIIWWILVRNGISLNINERWFSSLSIINACLAIYVLLTFVKIITQNGNFNTLTFLGEHSLFLFIIHHLERMEISYIWEMILEFLIHYIGAASFWVVWGIRSLFVILGFMILYKIFSGFNKEIGYGKKFKAE